MIEPQAVNEVARPITHAPPRTCFDRFENGRYVSLTVANRGSPTLRSTPAPTAQPPSPAKIDGNGWSIRAWNTRSAW
jgi:hypothetical protein